MQTLCLVVREKPTLPLLGCSHMHTSQAVTGYQYALLPAKVIDFWGHSDQLVVQASAPARAHPIALSAAAQGSPCFCFCSSCCCCCCMYFCCIDCAGDPGPSLLPNVNWECSATTPHRGSCLASGCLPGFTASAAQLYAQCIAGQWKWSEAGGRCWPGEALVASCKCTHSMLHR